MPFCDCSRTRECDVQSPSVSDPPSIRDTAMNFRLCQISSSKLASQLFLALVLGAAVVKADGGYPQMLDVTDNMLLDYVKVTMLKGLNMDEAPKVPKSGVLDQDAYARVYGDYKRLVEEEGLLDDLEEAHEKRTALQKFYSIGARISGSPNAEVRGGFSRRSRFEFPAVIGSALVSAKLRIRNRRGCSIKVYKVEDDSMFLVADLNNGSGVVRGGMAAKRFHRIVDLSEAMKNWLRSGDTIELQVWSNRRSCLMEPPKFDVMASHVDSRSGRQRRSSQDNVDNPEKAKLGSTKRVCSSEGQKSCCVRSLNVSVASIGWDDWIIEPKTFQANFCRGLCLYRNTHFSTSHALLQSKLSRVFGSRQVPKPCCAPTRLRALPVMYKDNRGEINFGRIPKMIVRECTCM